MSPAERLPYLKRMADHLRSRDQAVVRTERGVLGFFEDLPSALDHLRADSTAAECRVHFHVPVFARGLGPLGTTAREIEPAVCGAIDMHGTTDHPALLAVVTPRRS